MRALRCSVLLAFTIVAGALLLLGCGSKARRHYRLAETMLADNKPELAAVQYERLVKAYPNDPLAPAAHYKLAYLLRTHASDVDGALGHYRVIVEQYPASEWADDALQWMAALGRQQKNIPLIREVVNRLENRYPNHRSACARARVQLALALLEAGRPETKTVCQSIISRYPDQPNQCAQAQLILGRAFEKIDKNPDAAVKQWEKVRKSFPETTSAVEAAERIGWIFYGATRAGRSKPGSIPARSKRVTGVPAFVHEAGAGVQTVTLEALAVLLKHRKTEADLNTLMAVSGAAFQFVYDRNNRSLGSAVFATNPLHTTATSYNFVPLESSSSTPEEAMLSLCQTLDRDKPAMVPHTDGDWVIVVGYDSASRQFTYFKAGGGERRQSFDTFAAAWKSATDRAGGALDSYYQFALGPQKAPVTALHLVREAARRGASLLLQRTTVFGAPSGVAAYEALIADLSARGSGTLPEDAMDLAEWAEGPLGDLRESRIALAEFLEAKSSGLPEPPSSQARLVAARYRALAAKLLQLQQAIPRPPSGAQPGSSQPEYAAAALAAAQVANEALQIEREAADLLATLAGG